MEILFRMRGVLKYYVIARRGVLNWKKSKKDVVRAAKAT